jgi:hypothetical protein
VERHREMQKAGWILLEVNEEKRLYRGRPQTNRAAAAQYRDQGRVALRLLGE